MAHIAIKYINFSFRDYYAGKFSRFLSEKSYNILMLLK